MALTGGYTAWRAAYPVEPKEDPGRLVPAEA